MVRLRLSKDLVFHRCSICLGTALICMVGLRRVETERHVTHDSSPLGTSLICTVGSRLPGDRLFRIVAVEVGTALICTVGLRLDLGCAVMIRRSLRWNRLYGGLRLHCGAVQDSVMRARLEL